MRAIGFEDPTFPRTGGRSLAPPMTLSRRERAPERPRPSRAYRAGYALGDGWRRWGFGLWLVLAGPAAWYLAPGLWAVHRRHPHRWGILVWNAALGWTATGWIAALLYTLWTWTPLERRLP
jgi:hypothetical protein